MSEVSRRDFIKVTTGAVGGLLGSVFGLNWLLGRSRKSIEENRQSDILAHKANVLETDNSLGVKNAVTQFQVECKGRALSTFVLTQKEGEYPNRWPKVYTDFHGETVELKLDRSVGNADWFVLGKTSEENQYILGHQDKYAGNDRDTIHYWPPFDGKAESVKFDPAKGEIGYWLRNQIFLKEFKNYFLLDTYPRLVIG